MHDVMSEKNQALKPRLDGLRDETSRSFSQAHEQIARWRQADAHQADVYKVLPAADAPSSPR